MSLSSTPTLKSYLTTHLGPLLAPRYFKTLSDFFNGRLSRDEFSDSVHALFAEAQQQYQQTQAQTQIAQGEQGEQSQSTQTTQPAATPNLADDRLIQIHNALIISLFDATTHHRRSGLLGVFQQSHAQNQAALAARSAGREGEVGDDMNGKPPPRKRRRIVKGDGTEEGFWSERMRKWVVGLGRQERERVKAITPDVAATAATADGTAEPTADPLLIPTTATPQTLARDEVSMERAVVVLSERGDPPGLRRPMSLAVLTRAPTVQQIADRVNLITAQHDLAPPGKDVSALLLLALESKIKQLVTHALTLTQSGLSIPSIPSRSSAHSGYGNSSNVLTINALDTLFTISPSDLPHRSASVMTRLALGDEREDDEDADLLLIRDREVSDQRWQLMALLAERSAVREGLKTRPRT